MKIIHFGLLLLVCFATAVETRPFAFTAIPDEDPTRLQERFDRVAVYLAKAVGVEVRYIPVKSYAAAVTAFQNNQVQLGWFGGLSGVQARQRVPGAEAIAQGLEDRAFVTYFIANTSAGIEPSTDFPTAIAGKTFTFGAKTSTSGRLMPEYYIRMYLHRSPEEVFSRVGFSGDHSRTIALVQSGAYQIGAVNYTVWENELRAKRIDPAKIMIIWKTPPYPDYQWSIRADVDKEWGQGFKDRVTRALLDLDDVVILSAFPRQRFVPADNSDYEPIREIAKTIGLLD